MEKLDGYSGALKRLLEENNVRAGDVVKVVTGEREYVGTIIPRYEYASQDFLTLKLLNGYNIGISLDKILSITLIEKHSPPSFKSTPPEFKSKNLPKAVIVSTGGTIASRVDYRTGGVRPALSAFDLLSVVPELAEIAKVDAEVLFSMYSENMTQSNWTILAKKLHDYVSKGYEGVVVTHGTDTMGYTAAALSFALKNTPVPIVLVGSQRSSDRPSSDASSNLISAMRTSIEAPFSGVYVLMHGWVSDERMEVHLGTKVRKMHTSRRDAFKSINIKPAAIYENGRIHVILDNLPKRKVPSSFEIFPNFDDRVALIKFYPNMDPEIFLYLLDRGYRGIVLEGFGLGHVSSRAISVLKKIIRDGVFVFMTSQCIFGRVRLTVYDTGRDLLEVGVIPLEDMLSETAFVKLSWCLGNFEEDRVLDIMKANIAYEFSSRTFLEEGERFGD
ncbi:MAG: Glu-tRNA(Gln) amidotransferase subunit GatD [Nitrososphaeria archaeon]|nr:Glu-tRNA(Gln) amidotransferase subunit GatD [Nitrososphaeria archaeon]